MDDETRSTGFGALWSGEEAEHGHATYIHAPVAGLDQADDLKDFLAAVTSATNGSNEPTVAIGLHAVSRDGNHTLDATASTKLFSSSK